MAVNPLLIVGAAGAAGVALYAYSKYTAAKKAAALPNAIISGVEGAVGDIGAALGDLWNGEAGKDWARQLARDQTSNGPNGAIDVPNSFDSGQESYGPWGYVMQGPALRYKNGCTPFSGSPGWAKCAPGTVSMFAPDVEKRVIASGGASPSGGNSRNPDSDAAIIGNYAGVDFFSTDVATGNDQPVQLEGLRKRSQMMTGMAGDPTTFGPFGVGDAEVVRLADTYDQFYPGAVGTQRFNQTEAEAATGGLTWMVRGQRMSCPKGTAPKSVYLGQFGIANTDAVESCVDPNTVTNACISSGAPPGFTWDQSSGSGHWRKLNAGETANAGPCATKRVVANGINKNALLNESNGIFFGLDAATAGTGTVAR